MSSPSDDLEESFARQRVEANPTDLGLRFQLGKCLVRNRRFKEAILELQKARMNPSHRKEAMQLLADSYEAVGLSSQSEQTKRLIDWENFDDDDDSEEQDGHGGAGSQSPLKPISPRDLGVMKELPVDEK